MKLVCCNISHHLCIDPLSIRGLLTHSKLVSNNYTHLKVHVHHVICSCIAVYCTATTAKWLTLSGPVHKVHESLDSGTTSNSKVNNVDLWPD